MKKIFFFVILAGVIGGGYYYWWTGTPEYSIAQIRKAVETYNPDLGLRYIDTDAIFENYWVEMKSGLMSEALAEGFGMMFGLPFFEMMKPTMKQEFEKTVFFMVYGFWPKDFEVKRRGNFAYIETPDGIKLIFTQKEGARYWVLTEMEGLFDIKKEIEKEYEQILKEKEREQILKKIEEVEKEIAEINQKKLEAEKDKEELQKFRVLHSRFYFHKGILEEEPVIELIVQNDTEYPVSRAYFEGILITSGWVVPRVEDSFNYEIRGGLEPGEKATWKLAPGRWSEWGQAPKDRGDMLLIVIVKRIDGADGKPIFDPEFSEWDKRELERLTKRLEELKKNLARIKQR